ncbi:SDR family NAD(P)-dependent oxidoreductase [Conexibacter sp. SYSU D00693]|uniref:SDR family NAD(P)-dependent oxidoreductase n=1 Tax=Conexibacter sp. SYSU D00693 TaxID=2812560 RepID=UPI00196AA6F7|nr:SDR family oxidoreductase [Conexibacter sp. SYSU D00693]
MLSIDLSGKTAIVTGSTQGIGRVIVRRLAEAGATAWVNGRGEDRVARVVDELRGEGEGLRIEGVAADVATAEGARTLLDAVGHADVLVNNLGIFEARPVLEVGDEEWQRFWDTNVMSAIRLTRELAPGMRERGWGRVLFLASDSAVVIPVEMVHYGVTKTALLGVSRGFAKALSGTGVTVNAVMAGPTHTEGVEDFARSLVGEDLPWDEAQARFMAEHRPNSLIERLIEPEEIANMVAYLSSDLASATTGGALRVDGGYIDYVVP